MLVRAVGAAAFVPVQTPVRDDGRSCVVEDVDPFGRYVLMLGGYGEYVRLWPESGRVERLVDLPDGGSDGAAAGPQTVIAAALAPEGERMALLTDAGRLYLRTLGVDPPSNRFLWEPPGEPGSGPECCVSWSPDGSRLAASWLDFSNHEVDFGIPATVVVAVDDGAVLALEEDSILRPIGPTAWSTQGVHAVNEDTELPVHLIGDRLVPDSRLRETVYGRTPDGNRIVLVASDSGYGLHAIDQGGRAAQVLADDVPTDRHITAVAVARAHWPSSPGR